jgi:hypothetical protein
MGVISVRRDLSVVFWCWGGLEAGSWGFGIS